MNGDGYADILAGAPYTGEYAGLVVAFHGGAGGLTGSVASPAWSVSGADGDGLGASFAGAGDINGDGFADVVISAVASSSGSVYGFYGSATGLLGTLSSPAFHIAGEAPNDEFGKAVAGAGDVNGDGFADVIVGYPDAAISRGKAYVLGGGGGASIGRPLRMSQVRGDSSAPIQPWGFSYADGAVHVRMAAVSPWGRERARLQVQACPPGAAFGSLTCVEATSSDWIDTTATGGGAAITLPIPGLTNNTLYSWRARVLLAPFSVTQTGIVAPANPAHSRWQRLNAQLDLADVRVGPVQMLTKAVSAGDQQVGAVTPPGLKRPGGVAGERHCPLPVLSVHPP